MIDLRNEGLPKTITVSGNSFNIKTDFREWIKFGKLLESNCTYNDLKYLLEETDYIFDFDELNEMLLQFKEFYVNENSTPNVIGGSREKLIDYVEDGEFIYASFLQAYGIDLVDAKMHWHKFKALLISLPGDTKMAQIMQHRGYEESNKSTKQEYKELKEMWKFKSEIDEELKEELNELFYNS